MRDRRIQSARAYGYQLRWPHVHLSRGTGREDAMRKGEGEEARRARTTCDVCAAHGDRSAVGIDVDAQGSSLREGETTLPLRPE